MFCLSPMPQIDKGKRKIAMKTVKKLLLTVAFVFCISLSASAQQQQERDGKKPTKKNPPVIPIVPKDKSKDDKKKDERENDNRGKKPQAFIFDLKNTIKISFV
jgi:hypothetical protein